LKYFSLSTGKQKNCKIDFLSDIPYNSRQQQFVTFAYAMAGKHIILRQKKRIYQKK